MQLQIKISLQTRSGINILHHELLKCSQREDDLISSIDENQLRDFLKNEMKQNPKLKTDFLDKFAQE